MIEAVRKAVSNSKIGVAFSGGVDSSLLAKLCTDLGYETTLLTIGIEGSHDIKFSKEIVKLFGYKHRIEKISPTTFSKIANHIRETIDSDNLSWLENCIAFYHVSKLAKTHGIERVLTANGIDELFCGYNTYREAIKKGEDEVLTLMKSKLENEINMMKAVNKISSEFGIQIVQPFLSKDFVNFSMQIPISEKIHGPDDLIRKHMIRKLAIEIGVPKEAALKRKKALQYGSLIHKTLIKLN